MGCLQQLVVGVIPDGQEALLTPMAINNTTHDIQVKATLHTE